MLKSATLIVNFRTVRLDRSDEGVVTARVGNGGLVYTLGSDSSGCNVTAAARDLAKVCYAGRSDAARMELEAAIGMMF
jgi:hypothetical protein